MKLTKSQIDTRTTHEFELAGKKCRVRFDRWFQDEDMINGTVRVADPVVALATSEINIGGVGVYTKEEAAETNEYRLDLIQRMGITLPFVRAGEIDDKASIDTGDVRVLCEAVGLDPDDSAHYHEVDLAVRSASLTLARKIAEKSKKTKRKKR